MPRTPAAVAMPWRVLCFEQMRRTFQRTGPAKPSLSRARLFEIDHHCDGAMLVSLESWPFRTDRYVDRMSRGSPPGLLAVR